MLFGYRSGQNEISRKAWAKLREAEVKAGISEASKIEEAASVYAFEDRVNWKQRALDAERKIETLKKALQGLIREL